MSRRITSEAAVRREPPESAAGAKRTAPAAARRSDPVDNLAVTVRRCLRMLPSSLRWQWVLMVPVALISGAAEAGAAATVFALIDLIGNPEAFAPDSWVARVEAWLPYTGRRAVVLQFTALVVAYQIGKSLLLIGAQHLRQRVAWESSAELASAMLRSYLRAPYTFHLGRNSAELIRNCSTAVSLALSHVLSASIAALSEILVALGLVAVLLYSAPLVTLMGGGVLLGTVLLLLRLMRSTVIGWGRERHELQGLILRSLNHALGGFKELRLLRREHHFQEIFDHWQRRMLTLGSLGVTLEAIPALIVETLLVSAGLALLAWWTVSGEPSAQTLPLLALFAYAAFRLVPMTNRMVIRLNEIRAGSRTVEELHNDFLALGLADDAGGHHDPASRMEFRQSIELRGVSFTYPGAPSPAMKDVSLVVRRGESIGIVGPTGAGKSTLLDVLMGLLPPDRGRVLIDGVDLKTEVSDWQRLIGYVPQNVFLIDDSLRHNIAIGLADDEIDEDRLLEVVRLARLDGLIASLPKGLDTLVGERGSRLSAGERQRIGVARALYHDPEVVVFDEATSSLDMATEEEILNEVEKLCPPKTWLVVSHRLSAVHRCDRLLLLVRGGVVASGSWEEVEPLSREARALTAP